MISNLLYYIPIYLLVTTLLTVTLHKTRYCTFIKKLSMVLKLMTGKNIYLKLL